MSEPEMASKTPLETKVEAGQTYWWCSCGKSQDQPFCDGSHKGSHFSPIEYTATESTTVWFCGCKKTAGQPMCDGSHNSLA